MAVISSQLSTGVRRTVDHELYVVLHLSGLVDQMGNSEIWQAGAVPTGRTALPRLDPRSVRLQRALEHNLESADLRKDMGAFMILLGTSWQM